MDRPETRYARSGDVMIAYQVTGEGNPVDLVFAPGVVSHLDLDWEDPEGRRWIEEVSSYCRFIRFDKRGTGLSDRGIFAATLEERTDDIRAVMDAAGSERAVVFGYSEGGCMACVFAATYPERTRGLLLWGTMPRWVRTDDYPWGFDRDEHTRIVAEMAEQGMTVEYLTGQGAGMAHASEEDVGRYHSLLPSGGEPHADGGARADESRHGYPGHPPDDPCAHPDLESSRRSGRSHRGRSIHGEADPRLLGWSSSPEASHGWSNGPEDEEINDAIQEFVTGERPAPRIDRVLTTVLFTDIVGSTEKSCGDRRCLVERAAQATITSSFGRRWRAHQGVERRYRG